jgi:hypothetical protein
MHLEDKTKCEMPGKINGTVRDMFKTIYYTFKASYFLVVRSYKLSRYKSEARLLMSYPDIRVKHGSL